MSVFVDSPWFGFDAAFDPPHLRRGSWFWLQPGACRSSGEIGVGPLRIVWSGKRKEYKAPGWTAEHEGSEPDELTRDREDKSIVAGVGRLGFTWRVLL